MADRKHVDQFLSEVMRQSLADFADDLSLPDPLKTPVMFIRAYLATAELTPKRNLEALAHAAAKTSTDFAGVVLVMLSEIRKDLPPDKRPEIDVAVQLGVQASVLFNVHDNESDHELIGAMLSCYAAMLDPDLRGGGDADEEDEDEDPDVADEYEKP